MRLLLVEDDQLLGDGLKTALSQEGYAVDWVSDGPAASLALQTHTYELAVLDLNLPGKSGLDVLRDMRRSQIATPVLILTARDTVTDRVEGLDSGADDYLQKPFELDELCARLRALLRRGQGRSTPTVIHGDVELDPAAHKVFNKGREVELSLREYELLKFLLDNRGRAVSRARIEEALYPWNAEIESNAIEVHVHHLRKKLDTNLIRTLRGVGYIIDTPQEQP
ncbi:response regulator [Methylogaea oryzae]|uniref:DNA-binding response regulator n=1 Tax=Methylogaea oryzae TaxID=1295382 RepID=A0A8D4VRB9_9GAMM|nr:response regulator [Methylogaea oryzae]BBL72292.1 DNA-binding response regulator [Methylogaea oryzae]